MNTIELEARRLRNAGLSYKTIMKRLGLSYERTLDILAPEQAQHRREYRRVLNRKAKRRATKTKPEVVRAPETSGFELRTSAKRVVIPYVPDNPRLTGRLLGDPRLGRSALEQMGGRYRPSYPSYNGE